MGNHGSTKPAQVVIVPHQEKIKALYQSLCDYGILSKELFEKHFSGGRSTVACNLFDRYFIDLLNSNIQTESIFVERGHNILEIAYKSQDEQIRFYFDLISVNVEELSMDDVRTVIINCSKFGMYQNNVHIFDDDYDDETSKRFQEDYLINGLVDSCLDGAESIPRDGFVSWANMNCSTIFTGLKAWLHYKFTEVKMKESFEDEQKEYTWNLLYDSNQHGLSLNRFKHKVMAYKSPTITIIEFSNALKLAIALDQNWTDSAEKFGGPYCQLFELSPKVHLVEANSKMVYLKETGRSVPIGLHIGSETRPKVKINTDLYTAEIPFKGLHEVSVNRIEIWGCGGVEAIRSQADVKKWERNEIEKRKKVKLPGQWDTDKTILEMGGVRVNHSQRGDVM